MIGFSLRRPVAITMAYMTITALGIASWKNIPIELLPDTELPRLNITASWNGASPEVMEAFVASPLERAVQQVRGVEKITSTSSENSVNIAIEFALDTDMEFARLELAEHMAALENRGGTADNGEADQLPVGVRPLVQQYVPDDFQEQTSPLLRYTLTGPYMLEYLRQYIDETVAPELRDIEGVGEVQAYGGRARVLEIELDENRIRSLGLVPAVVRQRVSELEFVQEAGAVLTPDSLLRTIAIRERAESADEIRALPVLLDRGRVVRIADVGTVHETWEDPRQYFRIDGFPAVSLVLYRAPRTNAVATAQRVRDHVAELEHTHPSGVRLLLEDDQSEDIKAQLSDLRNRSLISAAIVLMVLLIFLRSIRASVVVFATVVFSLVATINVMYFSGFTLNLLTLMGLAMGFGLIVDCAIVVLENIYRLRRSGESPHSAAEKGSKQVVLAIVASIATNVVVLIPFVYLQGELRMYYVPLALVVGIGQVVSLFIAFTFIPSLSARLIGAIKPIVEQPAAADARPVPPHLARVPHALRRMWIIRLYAGLIRVSLVRPWVTVSLSVLALAGSWFLFDKYVSRNVRWGAWGDNKDSIQIQIVQQRGEELEKTDELARFFEARLREMPEIDRFTSVINPQNASIRVTFPDSLQYSAIPPAIKEQLVQYSLLFGGTDVRVYGYGPSFYGGGGGSSPNYAITILGYNYDEVRKIAEDLGRRLERFSRIREVDTNSAGQYFQRDKVTEIVVDIDRDRLALHDLSARDVVAYVASAVRGRNVQGGNVRIGGEDMQLEVKLAGARNFDVLRLQDLLLPTSGSREGVRLSDVADIRERQVLNRVIREDQQYQRIVSYEFRGPTKLGDRVKESVLKATALPPGYTIKDRQLWSFSTEDAQQIWGVTIVAVILVYMVTAAVFESIKLPFCVLLTVPMALIGVFLVFFYTGANFTREAYVGVIMMSGIVVNAAILLVDHVNNLRRDEGMPLHDAVIRGTVERVRPILMTSLTTICGLLPLVLFAENANANIWNALGFTLIGGLASSTILVLTVTPALYLIFERGAERRRVAAAEGTPPAEALAVTPPPLPA
jgi:HAE1 family hydrophobic/amphiphilic exporter-1